MLNKDNKYIMGILNVTPDSFSDGNEYMDLEKAYKQVEKMISNGANIIDVGGESTRPNATFVDSKEEIKRVIPIIKMIKKNFDIMLSIDTYKSEVAKEALIAGADIINDVWSNKYDGKMLNLVKEYDVYYIAMHNQEDKFYKEDLISVIKKDFNNTINEAKKLNIKEEKIILDPGIGFAKDINNNLEILARLDELKEGFNNIFLLGTSRKSFIGQINKIEEANKRIIGTCVTTMYGLKAGFEIFRVHDVKENKEVIEMIEAIDGK